MPGASAALAKLIAIAEKLRERANVSGLAEDAAAAAQASQAAQAAQEAGPLLGRYPTTTPGRIVNETVKGGGYSVNLPSGERPTEGLMMGKYANTDPRNMVLQDAITRRNVLEMAQKNEEALGKPENYLGTWVNPEEGKTYLDVSRRFPPDEIRQATKFGERTGQLSGYDVGKGESFPVGNWEQFVQGPAFQGRLGEL